MHKHLPSLYILVEKIDKLLVIPKTRRALYNVSQIFCFANGWGHALVRCQDLLQKLFSWVIHGIHELPCDKGRTTCKNGVIFGSSQDRSKQTLEVWHIPSYFQGFLAVQPAVRWTALILWVEGEEGTEGTEEEVILAFWAVECCAIVLRAFVENYWALLSF